MEQNAQGDLRVLTNASGAATAATIPNLNVVLGLGSIAFAPHEDILMADRADQAVVPEPVGEAQEAVIDEVQHSEPAAAVDPAADAETAALLCGTSALVSGLPTVASDCLPHSWGRGGSSVSVSLPSARSGMAQSAPAVADTRRCFLLGTRVLARGRVASIADLQVGQHLRPSSGGEAVVRIVRRLPARERDVVCITFADTSEDQPAGQLAVTASHTLPARRPSSGAFEPRLAAELALDDRLRTYAAEVKVVQVERRTEIVAVVEMDLEDVNCGIFAATAGDSEGHSYVAVYGALTPPLRNDQVKLLTFSRFDRFREALLEGEELRACRQSLESAGYSSDLAANGLGPGKLFVPAHIAWQSLVALSLRPRRTRCSDVVVSHQFEPLVMDAVQRFTTRAIRVQSVEVLGEGIVYRVAGIRGNACKYRHRLSDGDALCIVSLV